jgi:hypothetical protein
MRVDSDIFRNCSVGGLVLRPYGGYEVFGQHFECRASMWGSLGAQKLRYEPRQNNFNQLVISGKYRV